MKKDLISESIKGKRHVKLLLGRGKFVDFDEFYSVIKNRCPSIFASETSINIDDSDQIDSGGGPVRIRGRGAKGIPSESGIRMQLRVIFVKFLSRQRERRLVVTAGSAVDPSSSISAGFSGAAESVKELSAASRDQVDMEAFFKFVNSFASAS
jgi:hypothetical protein